MYLTLLLLRSSRLVVEGSCLKQSVTFLNPLPHLAIFFSSDVSLSSPDRHLSTTDSALTRDATPLPYVSLLLVDVFPVGVYDWSVSMFVEKLH